MCGIQVISHLAKLGNSAIAIDQRYILDQIHRDPKVDYHKGQERMPIVRFYLLS